MSPVTIERESSRAHRYAKITSALARHGLGFFSDRLGLERFAPLHHGLLGHARRDDPYTEAEHVRLLLEDLGPVAIKLGQMLSARSDLLPDAYVAELRKLQDRAPVDRSENPLDAIVAEFGIQARDSFSALDPEPIASASLGQAYAGVLSDGTEIIVKIRRPGIEARVAEDLGVLRDIAALAARHWHSDYDFIALEEEFARTLRAELDYVREARNAERFRLMFRGDAEVRIPNVFYALSSTRVLTLERMRGAKVTDRERLIAGGIDVRALAERMARLNLRMTLEEGFYHADPHPGNFFVEPNGTIELIDFGMTGTVDAALKRRLIRLFLAVQTNEPDRAVDALLELGVSHRAIDRNAFERDVRGLLEDILSEPLEQIGVATLLTRIVSVVRAHSLQLPAELALLLKTWAMGEGLVGLVDPSVSLAKLFAPFAQRLMAREFSPARAPELARMLAQEGMEAVETTPGHVRRLLADLERGSLVLGTRVEGLNEWRGFFRQLANRLLAGMVLASLIPALAILMLFYHPANAERLGALAFALGAGAVAILAAYLAWTAARRIPH